MRTGFRGPAVFTPRFLLFGLSALAQIKDFVLVAPAVRNPLDGAIVGALVEIRERVGATKQVRRAPFDGHQRSLRGS